MRQKNTYTICMALLPAAILLAAVAALCLGQFRISPGQIISEFSGTGQNPANVHTVLFNIRIPRIMMALLGGAGLSCAGAAFQSFFANPLATPDTLGVANGASFGAALGILLGFGAMQVQLLSFAFGVLSVLLVFSVTRTAGSSRPSMIMVILAGMVISSLFSALVSLVKYAADPQDVLPVITFWLMGSFSGITRNSLTLGGPLIAAGTLLLFLLRFRLNALSLPEDEAKALGVNLPLVRGLVIVAASAVTASVVSMCGVIGWVGLLIPHLGRMAFGNDNRRLLPFSVLAGGLFMLVTDTIARCATASEIPVSILTAVVGAPVFLMLLRKTGGFSLR
ncbi:MAG: iron ABC transporter permease [Stomatobaculum sp.]|nr:iron ABC transporter permease [Stomatobaculum sp.]